MTRWTAAPATTSMIGGTGDDTYEYKMATEFGELEGQGIDTVVTNQNYYLGNHSRMSF